MSARFRHNLRLVPLNDPSAALIGLQLHTPIQPTCPPLHILDQTTEKKTFFQRSVVTFSARTLAERAHPFSGRSRKGT